MAFHKSIYSVASHVTESDIVTLRNGLAPIFTQLDVDLVIQGHDHVYARSYMMGGADGMTAEITDQDNRDMLTGQESFTNPDGVMYVTFNSGSGSKNYKITSEAFPYTDVQYQNNGRSYSHLSVDGDSLTVTTYNLENGTITDTFTINKTTGEVPGDTTNPDNTTDPTVPGDTTGTTNGTTTGTNVGTSTVPQTGDDAQLTLWAVLAMAAAAAVAIPAARRILVKRNG